MTLLQAVADFLLVALALSLSPMRITAVAALLGTPRARANGSAFAIGWVAALWVATAVVLVLTGDADDVGTTSWTIVCWTKFVVGIVFVVLAALTWMRRPAPGSTPKTPSWVNAIDSFTPLRAGLLGVTLVVVNPKSIVLVLAAAAAITQAGLTTAGKVVATVVFVALASATVAGPVTWYLVAPEVAARRVADVRHWVTRHAAAVVSIVLLVLGASLALEGGRSLWSEFG